MIGRESPLTVRVTVTSLVCLALAVGGLGACSGSPSMKVGSNHSGNGGGRANGDSGSSGTPTDTTTPGPGAVGAGDSVTPGAVDGASSQGSDGRVHGGVNGEFPAASAAVTANNTQPAVAQPAQCRAANLAATDDGGQAAGGLFIGTFTFRNTGSAACSLLGYPGLERLSADGSPVATTLTRLSGPIASVVLQPQGQAYARFTTVNSGTCSPATPQALLTPPNETASLTIKAVFAPCASGSGPAVISVSPVVASRSALEQYT